MAERTYAILLKSVKEGKLFGREDYERFLENKISEKTARLDIGKLLEGNWLDKISKGSARN